jgi:hypothetical protein
LRAPRVVPLAQTWLMPPSFLTVPLASLPGAWGIIQHRQRLTRRQS